MPCVWHCCAEPCFWHFCQSINTGALSAEIQDTQITLSLLHLTWEPSTHINSYRPALYNKNDNSKFLGKRKAYNCGWIYPEYSLARTFSVFRFQHFERSQKSPIFGSEGVIMKRTIPSPIEGLHFWIRWVDGCPLQESDKLKSALEQLIRSSRCHTGL